MPNNTGNPLIVTLKLLQSVLLQCLKKVEKKIPIRISYACVFICTCMYAYTYILFFLSLLFTNIDLF